LNCITLLIKKDWMTFFVFPAQIESRERENLTSESFKYYFIHTKL
jgi:hypothetical protein